MPHYALTFFETWLGLGRYTMDLPCDSTRVYLKYIYTYEHHVYDAYHMFRVNFDMAFWWVLPLANVFGCLSYFLKWCNFCKLFYYVARQQKKFECKLHWKILVFQSIFMLGCHIEFCYYIKWNYEALLMFPW
jgi:hypothetical protein